ncbi:MAG: bacillithiol biosynthesis BshC [bacterium]|nr:MAG: bacillithiol biosynthesis BshC [bacterium]
MDFSQFECIDPSRIGEFASPWNELLDRSPHRLLPESSIRFDWKRRLDSLSSRDGGPQALCADLVEYNRKLGAPRTLLSKAERIFAGSGGVVIAGQQPGLFGGPLYTLFKALTAVTLARSLEESYGIPVLVVFWNAGDDDDFHEVRSCTLAQPDGDLFTISAERDGDDGRLCVGGIPIERVRAVLGPVRTILGLWGEGSGRIAGLIGDSLASGRWGDHFSRLLTTIFDGSLLVYDALSSIWRTEAAPLIERFVAGRDTILSGLRKREEQMRSLGVVPPIQPRTIDIPLTYIDGGIKRKFSDWDRQRIEGILGSEPSRLNPNVTLRAPLQDALFPVIASVVGPGETAYLPQLSPVYDGLGIEEPIRVPRFTATLVPSGLRGVAEAIGVTRSGLYLEWERCIGEYIEAGLPEGFSERIDELAGIVEDRGRRLVAGFRKGGELERDIERIKTSIRKLRRRGGAVRLGELEQQGFKPARLRRFLRPKGLLQERILSSLVPLAAGLPVSSGTLAELASTHLERLRSLGSGHYLVDLPMMD